MSKIALAFCNRDFPVEHRRKSCIGRMDGAQLGSIEVSQGKARTALQFKRPSKAFQDLIDKDQGHLVTLGHITAVQGGLPIMAEGKVIGSIGVS